jgi:hypothetical protein
MQLQCHKPAVRRVTWSHATDQNAALMIPQTTELLVQRVGLPHRVELRFLENIKLSYFKQQFQ